MIVKNKSYEAVVEDLTLEGSGLCRVDGFAVFVPMTAVGDRIRFKAVKVQKNVGYGLLEQVITPSPARQKPDCPVFRQCGGCAFRHITYEEELRLKEKAVSDAFHRLGGFKLDPEPIIGCPEEHHYRNKAQYPLGVDKDGSAVAGFYARRSHRIVPADNCLLQDESFGPVVRTVLGLIDRYQIPVYDEETGRGMLRHLFLRRGPASGEMMVCLVSTTRKIPYLNEICQALTAAFPEIVSIVVNVNAERTNVILGRNTVTVWGKDTIDDYLLGVKLSIAPAAFYQVNSPQAARLYELGYEYAGFKGDERLLDLYCGIGSIGLGAYKQVGSLVGVEVVAPAVESARKNAAQNGMDRTEFFCADAGQAAVQLADRGETPEVIIVDPPRKGCDQDVIDSIVRMAPERVVMISCNPATAARDAKLLCERGYELVRYRGVDMFPKTGHIETAILLVKTKAAADK